MANPEHLKRLLESEAERNGMKRWNNWRKENPWVSVDLSNANLKGVELISANLFGVNLRSSDLGQIKIYKSDLSEANLRKANLQYSEIHTSKLNHADLRNADLRRSDLSNSEFDHTDFRKAKLSHTNFRNADLVQANLSGVNASYSDFTSANLRHANMRDANTINANFIETNFFFTALEGADLMNAIIGYATFVGVDLSKVKRLGSIRRYTGPSAISIDTLYNSKGNISEKFLKGCGLQDWEIESYKLYRPNLTLDQITDIQYRVFDLRARKPLQVHNLFISYSHKDSEFIGNTQSTLDEKGIRHWRDVHDAPAGPLESIVLRAMQDNPTVLLVLSKNSVESDWVEFEAQKARELEKKLGRHVLCPVALDDSWKTCNWSQVLRNQIMKYNILDFSNWQDETFFNTQFRKLLKGLDLFYKEN